MPYFPPTEPGKWGRVPGRCKGRQNVKKRDRFMHRFTSGPRKLVARAFAAAATASIAALLVSSAVAQQQPAKPAPRPAPAKPAQPAQAQPTPPQAQPGVPGQPGQPNGSQAQMPQLIFSQWVKFCVGPDGQPADQKDPQIKTKQVCFTGIDGRVESGMPVVALVAIEPPGDGKKIMRITLPLGMHLQHGTRLIVDQAQPLTAPYVTCFANGCMADYELNADTLAKVKTGKVGYVQGINYQGGALSVPVPLTEFAKAWDGPPSDPKVLEERQ